MVNPESCVEDEHGIISLVSDFSISCVIEGGRVSLAHLIEFSHFVDLYVLEGPVFLDATSLSIGLPFFDNDPNCPLKALPQNDLSDAVYRVAQHTREIYDAAPTNYTFAIESYD